jgi:hypothetical protein
MNAQVKTVATVLDVLTKAAKAKATDAIDKIHQAYFVKGGIRDTTDVLRGQVEKASDVIFSLAQFATRQSKGDLPAAVAVFGAMCSFAEAHYKKEHEVENLKEALPVWATFKSNILGGMNSELSPLDFKSEYDFRKARMEKVRESVGVSLPPPTTEGTVLAAAAIERKSQPAGPVGMDEIDQWLGSTAIHDSLRVLLANVILSVEYIRRAKVGDAEAILRETGDRLAGLVDKRKINAPG